MAHARGPESLKDLAAQTGAIPVSVEQVVQDVDMLFIVVPQKSIPELPKGFLNKAKKETILVSHTFFRRIGANSLSMEETRHRTSAVRSGRDGARYSN